MADDFYDDLTSRRIDGAPRKGRREVGAGRRALGGGVLLSAVALGLQEVFDPKDVEEIVEEVDAALDEDQAVTLHLVRGFPRRSLAVVRPWLLA